MSDAKPRKNGISVRVRLLAIALLPTLVILPLFLGVTFLNWSARFDQLLIAKVNGELTIAHQYVSRIKESTALQVRSFGESALFADTLENDPERLAALLEARREAFGLDFLYLIDSSGVVAGAPAGDEDMDRFRRWPVVRHAIAGHSASAIDIFSAGDLLAISPALADRARLPLVPTKAARPTDAIEESRGMVLHAASTVAGGRALVGGLLLNRNLAFIDTINGLVYPTASLIEGSIGTATLFLEDVRISTNVRLFQQERALGTRVSDVVRKTVLDEGSVWLDRAFVVNDWYISAYEPITDSRGERVGMLYVGFLDTPFRDAKWNTLLTFAAAFFGVVLLSVPIFLRWARQIFTPLQRMLDTISQVEGGHLGARTGVAHRGDEIGRVAGQMDTLLDQIQERDKALRSWAEELNARVAERTRELEEANTRLEATSRQLVMSEKLAAVGEIAAGIAHEINNPIAVIQGNLDLIQAELGPQAEPLATEFKLIHEQVHSIFIIVNKLLQFTRPDEFAAFDQQQVPSQIIDDSVPLVQHLLSKVDIALDLDLQASRLVAINRTELQQVLINLMVNAIHAMPQGGTLTLRTRDETIEGRDGVRFEVTDTGVGMPPEVVQRAFDPFYTTKQGEGSGLGLSISRKLILRYSGTISVESAPGEGTTFRIWLPEDA
ncbi:HAMP domain-containing protein [Aliiruegeria haliotis]|uniref:histidine kinase n=1 Tax=Aliiruegeria haliotis TaxID=1280846 RepID=A0A2T0RPK5_9RHOB|nr:ATP-binding protein [Aliiruegeria haliotis]PRY23072.1 HAMP domain-containing protein [Aliiruegeria haliotis]